MTLLTYQVFKTVADIGSFHKAAEILGLTPSAISHTISNMENELGFTVLTRSKSGIKLTNYGEHILPYVNAVLNSDESLQQVIAEMNGLKTGKVKIGVFSSVCINWMPDILSSFKEKYEGVEIEVFQGTYSDIVEWLKTGAVDLGLLSVSGAKDIPIEPLYNDPIYCIMQKGKRDASLGDTITLDDLKHYEFVTQRENTDADSQMFLKEKNLRIESKYHTLDDFATVRMVEQGYGVCLIPELILKDIPTDVQRFQLDPPAYRSIGIATMNPGFMAPAVRSLYNHIVEMYKEV